MEKPINCFPGYQYVWSEKDGKYINLYRGENLGHGGWVYTKPGIYTNIALLDAASLHPTSIVMLNKLGKYTDRYADLRKARVYIKHGDYEAASKLFDGKLAKYLTDEKGAEALSAALKLPLNAFFGISFAGFPNPARDSRDHNNIIALRGALFMKTLFDEVADRGYQIIHVKTDSIKVANADISIIKFVQEFAKKYGYEMEHEATYDRICLVDKAQYVASYTSPEKCVEMYGYSPKDNIKHFKKHTHPWTTTGDKFQHPYLFKTLFSGDPISFEDQCELKTVQNAAIYLDMNEGLPDVSLYEKELTKRKSDGKISESFIDVSNEELEKWISEGHNYQFIGRTGRFVPIKPGCGGGLLLALRNGKYDSVNGTKDYRWLEAEVVQSLHMENKIDKEFFNNDISKAIASINEYGDFDRFIDTSVPYECAPKVDDENTRDDDPPFDLVPCGDNKYHTCLDCPECKGDVCKKGYSLNSFIERGGEEV